MQAVAHSGRLCYNLIINLLKSELKVELVKVKTFTNQYVIELC